MFNGLKSWLVSKTIWGAVIVLVSTALKTFGVGDIPAAEQAALTDSIMGLVTTVGQFVGAVIAIYGRVKAEKKIG